MIRYKRVKIKQGREIVSLPITDYYLNIYIKEKYPAFEKAKTDSHMLEDFEFLQQTKYGKNEQNCSLVSITAAVNYLENAGHVEKIYKYVRKLGKCFLYTPHLIGTVSLFIGMMYSITKHQFLEKEDYIKTKRGYLKGIGFSYEKICNAIDEGRPVILSMFNDGRGLYKNHTITVVGYKSYILGDKKLKFLIVNDNWAEGPMYLDYKKMWIISSIYY